MKIGIDVGYGYTKVIYGEDYERIIFPSISTKAEIFDGIEKDYGNFLFEYNGKKSFIGDAAMRSRSKFIRSAFEGDRVNSDTYQDLFLCGLAAALKEDSEVKIVTGLPINAFKLYREDIEKFKGRHFVKINNKDILIHIKEIRCIPQPLGTYIRFLQSHPEIQNQLILIVDIGFKTTDLLIVDHDIPLPASQSINFGMSDVARTIVDEVNKETDSNYTINQVDALIDNGYVYMGFKKEINESLLESTMTQLADGIWNRVQELYPDYKNFEHIIFTGGTAKRLEKYIDKIGIPSFQISTDSQFSNAIGYRDVLA